MDIIKSLFESKRVLTKHTFFTQRLEVIRALNARLDEVETKTDGRSFLEDRELTFLKIKVASFEANSPDPLCPSYFQACSLEEIWKYPLPDGGDEMKLEELTTTGNRNDDRARVIQRYLRDRFFSCRRKGFEIGGGLGVHMGWRGKTLDHLCLFDRLDNTYPHLILMTIHDYEGNESSLLRGEVLTILRVMRGRFMQPEYRSHIIIPVMMISSMGKNHARILDAYFSGDELVIRKTRLYSFENERNAPTNLFFRYMLSQPSGRTGLRPVHPREDISPDSKGVLETTSMDVSIPSETGLSIRLKNT